MAMTSGQCRCAMIDFHLTTVALHRFPSAGSVRTLSLFDGSESLRAGYAVCWNVMVMKKLSTRGAQSTEVGG